MQVKVTRKDMKFIPDPTRVIARFTSYSESNDIRIIKNVLSMSEQDVDIAVNQVLRGYAKRHRNISNIFEKHFKKLKNSFEIENIIPDSLNQNRRLLIGSYFTMEYSIESAAYFNPSIVEHPDQTELHPDEKRIIMSFRATGEGHISSIVFRSGVLDKNNDMSFEPR